MDKENPLVTSTENIKHIENPIFEVKCKDCNGQGSQFIVMGNMMAQQLCPKCQGSGWNVV